MLTLLIFLFCLAAVITAWGIMSNYRAATYERLSYSVIVACRNEEENLPRLIESLKKIEYDKSKYEIILVDDNSWDNTWQIMQASGLKCLKAEYTYGLRGKKAALQTGAMQAKYDYLALTDADCVVPPDWLSSYNRFFEENTALVVGYSPEVTKDFWQKMKYKATALAFAATTGLSMPYSCTGRNLALRKKHFFAVGGYLKLKKFLAGDDKYLLQLFAKAKYSIHYNFDTSVLTFPAKQKKEQDKRRYGKFLHSRFIILWLGFCMGVFLLFLPYLVFKRPWYLIYYALSVDLVWFVNDMFHQEKHNYKEFLLAPFLPYLIAFFTIKGFFSSWTWKERNSSIS